MPFPRSIGASLFAASVFLAVAFVVLRHPFGDDGTQLATNLISTAGGLCAALGAGYAAWRAKGRTRRAWTFLALAGLSWGLGQATWTYYEEIAGVEVPFPGWADAGYLGFIPLALVGLSLFPSESTSTALRVRAVVDGLIIAASLFITSWHLLLEPLVLDASFELGFWIGIAYPAGDVLLATWVIYLGSRVSGPARARWWLIGGGILAFALADSAFLYLTAHDAYATGSAVDLGWFAGLLLIGLGGVLAGEMPAEPPVMLSRPTTSSMFVPYMPLAVAIVILAAVSTSGAFGAVDFWALIALGLLVALRQLLSMLENVQLARRLEDAFERLRESEHARTRLLNAISHDLMNPLTPVKLQLHLLAHTAPGLTESQSHRVGVVRRNLDVLQRLVADVKDLARLEGGELPLRVEPLDAGDLVRTTIDTFAPLASERGIRLAANAPHGVVVNADRERVTQILYNLVSNALKFTPSGGQVALVMREEVGGVHLSVADTGMGLTQDQMARMFKPFSQVHESTATSEKGTGLGLFLSRAIAQQHGGELWVESDGPREGSTFHLQLPRVVAR